MSSAPPASSVCSGEAAVFNAQHFPNGVNHPFVTLTAEELEAKYGGAAGIFHSAECRDLMRNLPGFLRVLDGECGFASLLGRTAVDVGCGTGILTRELATLVGPSGAVVGTEISPGFIALCRAAEAAAAAAQPPLRAPVSFVLTPEESLAGVESGTADLVLICDVYHHFVHPLAMMREVARVLRRRSGENSGGVVVLVDFHRDVGRCWSHEGNWVLDHVRADQATFEAEIAAAGFVKVGEREVTGLVENYIVLFRVCDEQ